MGVTFWRTACPYWVVVPVCRGYQTRKEGAGQEPQASLAFKDPALVGRFTLNHRPPQEATAESECEGFVTALGETFVVCFLVLTREGSSRHLVSWRSALKEHSN